MVMVVSKLWAHVPYGGPSNFCPADFITNFCVNGYTHIYSFYSHVSRSSFVFISVSLRD
jgi:hypothetical protein